MLLVKNFFEFHAQVQRCHFGNFSILPKWHFWSRAWHSKFFLPKTFFWSIMKIAITKFFHNLSQGPPNPEFMQEKVQKGDFLKKDSWELKFFSCFRFLWISRRSGTLNWERVVFLLSKIIYRKCEYLLTYLHYVVFPANSKSHEYDISRRMNWRKIAH